MELCRDPLDGAEASPIPGNSLSLLPLLVNLSQDASVLLSKSIEGKQLWFVGAFTATRTGLRGGAPSSHVAFCPPPLSVA